MAKFANIGFGNLVNTDRVLSVLSPDSAPAKRLVQHAKEDLTLVDATQGRKTKSLILTSEGKLILSALTPETLAVRFQGREERGMDESPE